MGELTKPHPATFAPAGSSRGEQGSNEVFEALGVKGSCKEGVSERAGRNMMNTEEVPKPSNAEADPAKTWGRLP